MISATSAMVNVIMIIFVFLYCYKSNKLACNGNVFFECISNPILLQFADALSGTCHAMVSLEQNIRRLSLFLPH